MGFVPALKRIYIVAVVLLWAGFGLQKASAEVEIDMADLNGPAPTATSIPMPVATPTPIPAAAPLPTATVMMSGALAPKPTATVQEESAPASETAMEEEPTDTPTPAVKLFQGSMHAKYFYEAGIKHYKEKDYVTAITYLKKTVNFADPYMPKYKYSEAYSTLGLIYEFYYPEKGHAKKAVIYYKAALRCDPNNRTARKYLKKLTKHSR
jgi:tetratricopeptide (TPR) repeat protein